MTDNFDTLSQQLTAVFTRLQAHATEYKCFESHDNAPVEGTFKVNGNGEVRVALDCADLRRIKTVNFRACFDEAIKVMTEAEKHMNELLGSSKPPEPSEFDLRLQRAVEDGIKDMGVGK